MASPLPPNPTVLAEWRDLERACQGFGPWSLAPACIFPTLDSTHPLSLMPPESTKPQDPLHTCTTQQHSSCAPSSPIVAMALPETATKTLPPSLRMPF